MSETDDVVDAVVCNLKDFDNKLPSMKEVDISGAGKCLLVRHENGELSAIGHKCTHYGAPLARGVISNGIIRCPWHGACFNARTGDIEDYPGLDSLHKYQVKVDERSGDVKIRAKMKHLNDVKRNSCLSKQESSVDREQIQESVVIIGGGPSSVVCAETLRKEAFDGKITIITKERHAPYDRAKLSKAPDAEPLSVSLRSDLDYYKNICVDLLLDTEAVSVDTHEKKISVFRKCSDITERDRDSINYDRLFIATGGNPRTLHPIPGWDSENIYILRTVDEANKLASCCQNQNVVLVGSSFIAMEIAAYLTKKNETASISVVCGKRSKVPFESSLGSDVGGLIMKMHQDKGVKFFTSTSVEALTCDEETKRVTHLTLSNGTVLEADAVVLGIGVTAATDFIKNSNIELDERGYVPVDCTMKTNIDTVYAGGDIVTFPLAMKSGQEANIQHWQMAHTHGRIAALGILDSYNKKKSHSKRKHVDSVPFFWTVQFGISIRYAGHGGKFKEVIIKGIDKSGKVVAADEALAAKKFAAFYIAADDCVVAVATMMADPVAAKFAQWVKDKGTFKADEIEKFLHEDIGNKTAKDSCNIA